MSQPALYREPVLLDTVKHRHLKLTRSADYSMTDAMHACFLATAEFADAVREFVLVFIGETVDGKPQAEPAVLLGVEPGENLYVDGKRWNARYVPAFIRRHPFLLMQVEGSSTDRVVMIDTACSGFSESDGEPLYQSDGVAAPRLDEAVQFMQRFEVEATRTNAFCDRLVELDLLRAMTANVTLADGQKIALDGLMTVDEAKLQALPDAQVLEMHRNGMLPLIYMHLLSLANMQALVERKSGRMQAAR